MSQISVISDCYSKPPSTRLRAATSVSVCCRLLLDFLDARLFCPRTLHILSLTRAFFERFVFVLQFYKLLLIDVLRCPASLIPDLDRNANHSINSFFNVLVPSQSRPHAPNHCTNARQNCRQNCRISARPPSQDA